MGLFGFGEPDYEKRMLQEYLKSKNLYEGIETPDVSWENFNPEDYSSVGELRPEEIQGQTLQEDPRILQEQRNYLNKLKGMSEEGLGAEDLLGFEMARRNAAGDAQSRQQSAMQNARARGVAGGGMEFALGEMGSQAAADRQSMEGMQQAAEAAKRRALMTTAYGGELSGQRGQNLDVESRNKDIINRFNQMNVGNRNAAQQYNLGQRQDIANQNVQGRNQAQLINITGRAGANQQGFQNQLSRANALGGQYDKMADVYGAMNEANRKKRGGVLGAIGGGIGAAVGGPLGYSVGSGIGGGLGGAF